MSLDVVNGNAWLAAVQNSFTDLGVTSEDELAGLGKSISKNMRDSAPVMEAEERARRQAMDATSVRRTPGKTTIRMTRGRDREGFYVDVGPNRGAFYLAFIEYGTRFYAAHPFLRPSIERAVAAWSSAGTKGA